MSIFNKLFSKNHVNEIKEITETFQKKEFDTVIKKVSLIVTKLKADAKKTFTKLLALSHFNNKNFSLALPCFEQIAENSTNPDGWFNVTTSAILAKEVVLFLK